MVLDFNHIYGVLTTSILETLGPTRCVACDMPGQVLCDECSRKLPFIDPARACPRCGAPYGWRLCTECPNPGSEAEKLALDDLLAQGLITERGQGVFPFSGVRAALSYEGATKNIVRVYKDGDELRLDRVIASFICNAIRARPTNADGGGWLVSTNGEGGGWLKSTSGDRDGGERTGFADSHADWSIWADAIAYVPASSEARLKRGFDHMRRIALICGTRTGLPILHALESSKSTLDQRGLGRDQRMANRRGSFSLAGGIEEIPANILLIDDVFTTGATLSAAADALLNAGAREVRAVTLARVW